MPYLTQNDKDRIDAGERPKTEGELTYALTRVLLSQKDKDDPDFSGLKPLVDDYIVARGLRYGTLAQILGCLLATICEWQRRRPLIQDEETAPAVSDFASEFYRTVVAPYEDKKIEENGDVYQ